MTLSKLRKVWGKLSLLKIDKFVTSGSDAVANGLTVVKACLLIFETSYPGTTATGASWWLQGSTPSVRSLHFTLVVTVRQQGTSC